MEVSNSENSHKGNHLNTRHSTNRTKIQTQSSADRSTTSLSLAHQRKNKQTNKNSALISLYTKLTQITGTTKRKKESNLLQGKNSTFLEAWVKENSNTINFLKRKKEKAEKYCTNEGTN